MVTRHTGAATTPVPFDGVFERAQDIRFTCQRPCGTDVKGWSDFDTSPTGDFRMIKKLLALMLALFTSLALSLIHI